MKLKFSNNESGYTLLLAVVVIVIFSILGLSLMTITSSGVTKNENRQDRVQAQDLADKGLDIVVKDIQKYLETQIKDTPMGKTAFETFLVGTLTKSSMQCPADGSTPTGSTGITVPGDNGTTTRICIAAVDMIKNASNTVDEKDQYKRIVTFKSYGFANGKQVVSTYKVILGTDAIPDQLRYAVSTNNGGNLFLHGGIELQGDIKTDGNLIISNYASWGTATGTSNTWTASTYPRMIKNTNSVNPKLILADGKEVYYFKLDTSKNSKNSSTTFYYEHQKGTYLNQSQHYDKLSFNELSISKYLFNTANLSLIRKKLDDDVVDIDSQFNNISNNAVTYSELSTPPSNSNKNKVYHVKKEQICTGTDWKGKCNKYGTSSGSIKLSSSSSSKPTKNLVGTYYVEGDVEIDNINLLADAILYVKGKVHINQSTIRSYKTDSTLFIFAKGDITFSNIHDSTNTNSDNINEIKGFFYSKSNMMLLGVKSHMRIIGGVSGNRVILTGVRGKGKNNSFDSVSTQEGKNARLQIIYDENLIKTFHEFKRDEKEEYITIINDPEFIERY